MSLIDLRAAARPAFRYLARVHAFEAVKTVVWFTLLPVSKFTDLIRGDRPGYTYGISIYQYYYLPLVGALKFGLTLALFAAASALWDPVFSAVLSSVFFLMLSGAIHLDGLTDTLDAVFAYGRDKWEVLKDPHIGSLGAAYLCCFVLMFVATFGYALVGWGRSPDKLLLGVALAHCFILPSANCFFILAGPVGDGEIRLDRHLRLVPEYAHWKRERLADLFPACWFVGTVVVLEAALFRSVAFTIFLALSFGALVWWDRIVLPKIVKALSFLAGDVFGLSICVLELCLLAAFLLTFIRG